MTWATIHYQSESTMAVEFGFAERQKDAIKAMTGAEWDKSSKRWLVPVARLGDVVKLFWPELSIDYMVLRARDQALVRMFEGYVAMGVRFDVNNGKVVCDQPLLNEWLAANATVLHVNALHVALNTKKSTVKSMEAAVVAPTHVETPIAESGRVSASHTANGDIALWLRGTANAAKREERKGEMLKRKRRRPVA